MLETEENQIDNKAFTAECHTVLMAGFGYIVCRWRKWKLMMIIAMTRGNKRSEIQRQVIGISV